MSTNDNGRPPSKKSRPHRSISQQDTWTLRQQIDRFKASTNLLTLLGDCLWRPEIPA